VSRPKQLANGIAVSLLLWIGVAVDAQLQPPAPSPMASGPFQISVNVDLVVLYASVRDRKGGFTSDLRQHDFEVSEDGVRQSIRLFRHEDIPVTVGLVVDHSGSMLPKLSDVLAAARTFVNSSSPQDQMFVVNFNERVTMGLPAAVGFTNRVEELEQAISQAPAAGRTALYDAVVKAQERLQAGSRDKKVLIIISDGGDNASAHTLADVLKLSEQSSALIYTIGIFDDEDQDQNAAALRRLARVTGGEAFFPPERKDVVSICESIARDIRRQYVLGYVSSNTARNGAYRSVRVNARADGKKLSVRTRSGYIAPKESPPPEGATK